MKKTHSKFLFEMLILNLGLVLIVLGLIIFLIPAKIAPGGISGLSTIMYYVFKFPVGLSMLILNIPLLIISIIVFGKSYGIKTIYGTVMLSVLIDLTNYFLKNVNITDNLLLAAIYGGIICGAGLGLIMRIGGSTGGTVTISQIINKYFKIPTGYALIGTDCIVLIIAAFVFGIEPVLYSIITLFVTGKVVNFFIQGLNNSKLFFIISDEYEKIEESISDRKMSGGTTFLGKGLYKKGDRKIIMAVIRNSETPKLRKLVNKIDPKAFVIISDAYEVMGEGFSYPRI